LKFAGCLLLISGWMIVLATLVLLPSFALRAAFIASGIAVEILGLGLIARGQVNEERQAQALKQSIAGAGTSRLGGAGFGGFR
jgi:hypothetical protein